jgi:hypothetical protein
MTTYEVLENGYIKKIDGESISIIPNNEANSDYQRYLEEQANDKSL